MKRLSGLILLFVLVSTPLLYAQRGGARGGGGRATPPPAPARGNSEGRGAGEGRGTAASERAERQARLKELQEQRKRLTREAQTLQDLIKRDRQARDQASAEQHTATLQAIRAQLKSIADQLKELQSRR